MVHLVAEEKPAAGARDRRVLRNTDLEGLARALLDDAAREGQALSFRVRESCGFVEVRVMGGAACLRLSFDHAEHDAAQVRQTVRREVMRYRSALAAGPGMRRKERGSC